MNRCFVRRQYGAICISSAFVYRQQAVHIYTYDLSMDNGYFYIYTCVLSMVDKLCDI